MDRRILMVAAVIIIVCIVTGAVALAMMHGNDDGVEKKAKQLADDINAGKVRSVDGRTVINSEFRPYGEARAYLKTVYNDVTDEYTDKWYVSYYYKHNSYTGQYNSSYESIKDVKYVF